MEQKQRLFIYDRREILILVALGVMVAAFAFTLGVHLGKKVTAHPLSSSTAEVPKTGTLQDSLPNKQELTEQGRNAEAAADAELTKTLHDEVQKTGIKIDTPRQVDLPTKTKSANAGATDLSDAPNAALAVQAGAYTLQIGSYPNAQEADSKMAELRVGGLHPYVRLAEVRGLGKRYRLYLGQFSTRENAEKAGRKYQSQGLIQSYLVSRPEK